MYIQSQGVQYTVADPGVQRNPPFWQCQGIVLTLSTPPIYKQNVCINIKHLVLNPPYKLLLAYGVNGHLYESVAG